MSGKSAALAMSYGHGRKPVEMMHLWDDMMKRWGGLGNLYTKDYQKLAGAVREIGDVLTQMLPVPMGGPDGPLAETIREMVAARLGLVLAQENKRFDSFRWAAACKGEKESE